MIRFIGRLTVAVIITAVLVFGGLLIITHDDAVAHYSGHDYVPNSYKPSIHYWVPTHYH